MSDYSVWYSETYTYKGYFTANSKEHALELLKKVNMGEIQIDELPEFGSKDKNYDLEISTETLEEN